MKRGSAPARRRPSIGIHHSSGCIPAPLFMLFVFPRTPKGLAIAPKPLAFLSLGVGAPVIVAWAVEPICNDQDSHHHFSTMSPGQRRNWRLTGLCQAGRLPFLTN